MPSWMPVLITSVFALINVFLPFYFKFVPDVNDQKRHLRQFGWWALDVATIVGQVWP